MGTVEQAITEKLQRTFNPAELRVINESHRHEGHAGHDGGGESHFRVEMTAEAFRGLPRVACYRLVHEALAEELAGPVHALSLKLTTG